MNILLATNSLGIGGAETHIVDLARALTAKGHRVVVVSYGGDYAPVLEADGIRHIDAPLNVRGAFAMMKSYRALKKTVKTEQITVLHAHARIPAFLCGIIAGQKHLRFVTTVHGAFKVNAMYRRFSRWGQHTLAVSPDLSRYLTENYGIPPEQITLTVNGIETDRFTPAKTFDRDRIIHISRLEDDTVRTAFALIEAVKRLRADGVPMRLVITGGGEAYDELTDAADKVNALYHDTVELTGARTDVEKVLSQGGIFVGTSRAALEAMSASLPVILCGEAGYMGRFYPDMLDLARDCNFTCRGSDALSVDALCRDILKVRSMTEGELKADGEYNRRVVMKYYSVDRMCSDALAVYEMTDNKEKK